MDGLSHEARDRLLQTTSESAYAAMADADRVEWHLLNWARYMRTGDKLRPLRAMSRITGAGPNVDDMHDGCDLSAAMQVDAIIRDLSVVEQCALHHTYLDAAYRFRDYEAALLSAKSKVLDGINRKGLA